MLIPLSRIDAEDRRDSQKPEGEACSLPRCEAE